MKTQEISADLKLVGSTSDVVLGTFGVGVDLFGELLGLDMEFAGDQPTPIS
jgi:hypothetical protein